MADKKNITIPTPGVVVLTPECDKMVAAQEESRILSEFIDWLRVDKNFIFAIEHNHGDGCYEKGYRHPRCGFSEGALVMAAFDPNKILAEYFEIDLDKVDREQKALLEVMRKSHEDPEVVDPHRYRSGPYSPAEV